LPETLLLDSITHADAGARGRVVVSGSHGGVYPASLALKAACRAVILHDAGVGHDGAGVAGLEWLEAPGLAAAAVDYRSADIGQAAMMLAEGTISHANRWARHLGVAPGMRCAEAARRLAAARPATGSARKVAEARRVLQPEGARRALVLIDSAALVLPEDAGQVVVTGSHGALYGSDPANALRADAFATLFNDAGGGVGTTRLPILEVRRIAAATVAAMSARIGEARSTWKDGVISAANAPARALGAEPGMPARDFVARALAG
jgi:nucleotidyltransferase/DNA polymerase involved in DNA repair